MSGGLVKVRRPQNHARFAFLDGPIIVIAAGSVVLDTRAISRLSCPHPHLLPLPGFVVLLLSRGRARRRSILLAAQPVDCILLDVVMPGLGGEATCRQIKGAQGIRDIPVILLTALEDRDTMIRGLDAGADDYIAKSSDFAVLKARVFAQMRRKQFEDETRQIRERLLRTEVEATEARAARELAETRAALSGGFVAKMPSSRRSVTRYRTICAPRCEASTGSVRR